MRLLVIGGTVFLGRHLVMQAMSAGHEVTTLNRGNHNLVEQSQIEKLIADRKTNLDLLAGRSFDAVIDTCGYEPDPVRRSVEALSERVGTYVFISTIQVHGEFRRRGISEQDQISYTLPGKQGDYGTLKADCEQQLHALIDDRALIVRPGLIVGPYDPTDRFTYWAQRLSRGGSVLSPGKKDRAIQFIDVRDLSAWILKLTEKQHRGVYNATGPREALSMESFLETGKRALDSQCEFIWLDDRLLLEAGVEPWTELPLWIPETEDRFTGFMEIDSSKAFKAGLTLRSLAETLTDTLKWTQSRENITPKAGLKPERESELLKQIQSNC